MYRNISYDELSELELLVIMTMEDKIGGPIREISPVEINAFWASRLD